MWAYDIDNFQPIWNKPDERIEALKKRDDALMIKVIDLETNLLSSNNVIARLEETVTRLTLFNVLYQFYFEGEFTHEETRRLVTMLNSPDEQDKNLAREIILKKIK